MAKPVYVSSPDHHHDIYRVRNMGIILYIEYSVLNGVELSKESCRSP